jgi:TPR repeat protein
MLRLRTFLALLLLIIVTGVAGPALAADGSRSTQLEGQTEDPEALLRLGDLYRVGEGVAIDLPKALLYYRQAMQAGSRTARLRAGEMLARGQGTPRDVETGTAIIREAAAAGDGNAYFLLGELLSDRELDADLEGAIDAYRQAARLGRDDALLRLGDLLSSPPNADLPQAFDYYQRASNAGSQTGMLRVGEMLVRGQGTRQDVGRGLALITAAADAGNVNGLILLGDLHSGSPTSVANDRPKALGFYRRAALGGEPRALLALGDALTKFYAGPSDGEAAIEAYVRAASGGSTDASLRLGDGFSAGKIVAVDLARAFAHYRKAAESGSKTGQLRMAEMLARGQGVPQDIAAGYRMVRNLVDEQDSRALLALGDLLSRGDAGPIDAQAAIRAYEAAADAGLADAFMRLGDLYREGVIVRRRADLAVDYYRRAADAGNPYGLYALGLGYMEGQLSGYGSPADAVVLLQDAEAAGVSDAVIAIANGVLFGYGTTRDVPGALAILDEAAVAGNVSASLRLVEIYRDGIVDGRTRLIRKDLDLARRYLSDVEDRLDRGASLHEAMLLDAASGTEQAYERIFGLAQEISPRSQEALLRELLTVNANAYTYVVQSQLDRLELFSGAKTGTLDRPTIRAINSYCALKQVEALCRLGPMSSQTARVLAFAF